MVQESEGELRAATLPAAWESGLHPTLAELWSSLPRIAIWDPMTGWRESEPGRGNPFPSACLLALLLVARVPEGHWGEPADIEAWIMEHHPYWKNESLRPSRQRSWVAAFLLGVAFQLKMLQAAKEPEGNWLVRLSPLGRWLLGLGDEPPRPPSFPQTVLVQPN